MGTNIPKNAHFVFTNINIYITIYAFESVCMNFLFSKILLAHAQIATFEVMREEETLPLEQHVCDNISKHLNLVAITNQIHDFNFQRNATSAINQPFNEPHNMFICVHLQNCCNKASIILNY